MTVIVIVLAINNTYSSMETTTATALATTAITTSELNTVAEDVQFEDINVTNAPSVNFLEAKHFGYLYRGTHSELCCSDMGESGAYNLSSGFHQHRA